MSVPVSSWSGAITSAESCSSPPTIPSPVAQQIIVLLAVTQGLLECDASWSGWPIVEDEVQATWRVTRPASSLPSDRWRGRS